MLCLLPLSLSQITINTKNLQQKLTVHSVVIVVYLVTCDMCLFCARNVKMVEQAVYTHFDMCAEQDFS